MAYRIRLDTLYIVYRGQLDNLQLESNDFLSVRRYVRHLLEINSFHAITDNSLSITQSIPDMTTVFP